MALATTTLVPILYDISKELENQQKLNGNVIYYNDPDKHVSNTSHLLRMGDKLLKYNEAKRVLSEEEDRQQMLLKFYTAIALVLIILLFIPVIGYLAFALIRQYQMFECFPYLVYANKGLLIAFLIILFIYCMMALVNLYQRNERIFKTAYNTDNLEANNDMISKVTKMFVKTDGDFSSDDKNIKLSSNSPLLMFTFAQAYKKYNITYKPTLDGNETIDAACSRLGKISEGEFLSKCVPRSHNGCMYPFIPSQPVNPIVLQKQIQKMDLYGQIFKINNGMNWFKAFLLKSTDAVYGKTLNSKVSAAEKRAILDKVVEALTKQFALVKDLQIDESKAQVSNMSEADCYNTFMSDPDCIAASYNAAQRKCILVKKGTVGALRFDKTGSNSVLLRASSPSTDILVVTADTLNQKNVKKSFKQDEGQGTCTLTTPGCLLPNSSNTWLGNQKTGDSVLYSDVFSGDHVAFDVNYVVKMSDVVKNNTATLDAVFLARKDQLSTLLTETIITADPTNTISLSQNDINYITKEVDKVNKMASIVVTDILMEVPSKLQVRYEDIQETKRKESSGVNKYVPYNRFVEKLNDLSSSKFVLEFINSAEDLRSCSTGVKDLYDNYDYSGFLQREQAKLSETSVTFYIVTGILGWLWYVSQDYLYSNNETDEKYCVPRPTPIEEEENEQEGLFVRTYNEANASKKPKWNSFADVATPENAKTLGLEKSKAESGTAIEIGDKKTSSSDKDIGVAFESLYKKLGQVIISKKSNIQNLISQVSSLKSKLQNKKEQAGGGVVNSIKALTKSHLSTSSIKPISVLITEDKSRFDRKIRDIQQFIQSSQPEANINSLNEVPSNTTDQSNNLEVIEMRKKISRTAVEIITDCFAAVSKDLKSIIDIHGTNVFGFYSYETDQNKEILLSFIKGLIENFEGKKTIEEVCSLFSDSLFGAAESEFDKSHYITVLEKHLKSKFHKSLDIKLDQLLQSKISEIVLSYIVVNLDLPFYIINLAREMIKILSKRGCSESLDTLLSDLLIKYEPQFNKTLGTLPSSKLEKKGHTILAKVASTFEDVTAKIGVNFASNNILKFENDGRFSLDDDNKNKLKNELKEKVELYVASLFQAWNQDLFDEFNRTEFIGDESGIDVKQTGGAQDKKTNVNTNATNELYSDEKLPSKEKKIDEWDTRINKGLKYLLILVFIIISYLVFKSVSTKDKKIKEYNRMIIETNGTIIVNNSRNLMQILYDDLSKDRYNISSSINKINLAPFIKKDIIINTSNQKTFKTQGVTEDEFFDVIAQHTMVSDSVKVKLNDSAKTEEVYNLLVQTLEAYEKCNTIASSQTPVMPLPIFQIVTYCVLIAITLGVIYYIMTELKPVKNFQDTMKLKAIIDRAETKHQIAKPDIDLFENADDPLNDVYTMNFVKIVGASLVVMFAILFAVQIEQNTNQFTTALYGGDLFRNNQCYE